MSNFTKLFICGALFLVAVTAQNSATTKPASYFTVDANAEHTSTQNWWGDNVDNGVEPTTASPPIGATGSGVSPPIAGQTSSGVQAAGVLSVESATVSGAPDTSSPVVAADDSGNSTQSSSNMVRLESGALLLLAYCVLN